MASQTSERIDRMYQAMKGDVRRHETLCYELATKFEQQNELLLQFNENIEALKTNYLVTDLHLEAYLPVQTALIAYDVGRGSVHKTKLEKFEKYFASKVIRPLEKNLLKVCDPRV